MSRVLYAVFKGDQRITIPREFMCVAVLDSIFQGYHGNKDYEVVQYEQN